jgi:glucose 1-dehydrogenase
MRFEDKVCIVTGGTSGIGKAACIRFGQEGGKVVVVGRNEADGNQVVDEITSAGGTALFVKADVGISAEIQNIVATTLGRWHRIDVIVNNAAMMTFKPIVELTEEEWDQLFAVNLKSAFVMCKYGLPHMKGGSIVMVSSVHAHQTTPDVVPYAASKGGLEAFVRGLSRECAGSGVRVNSVAPGAVDTPMLWNNPNVKSGKEKIEGAVGKPEDIAAAICFLASDEARFINGTTLLADGGRLDIL